LEIRYQASTAFDSQPTDTQLSIESTLQAFLAEQRLPPTYLETAQQWFLPLAERLVQRHSQAGKPLLVGINGSQGSGKSTLSALLTLLLTQHYGLRAIDLSIDDFYLTRADRTRLAHSVHPLLATRGVPGTHDVTLMRNTLLALLMHQGAVAIPRFDKGIDDRHPAEQWTTVQAPMDVVIVEGWCFGTPPQSELDLEVPVNDLERNEDESGAWRDYVNRQTATYEENLYSLVDEWIMLRAPSFDCVYQWRLEQEKKLAERLRRDGGNAGGVMSETQLQRFIQHYQRLTEQSLKQLPQQVHHLYELDAQRQIVCVEHPVSMASA
jgi:D-glycerate 3-kinase